MGRVPIMIHICDRATSQADSKQKLESAKTLKDRSKEKVKTAIYPMLDRDRPTQSRSHRNQKMETHP